MERDFLGLASNNVTDEQTDSSKDSVPMRSSTMQWSSSSNKVSAAPQFLSFKSKDDPMSSTADAFDSNQKLYSSIGQKIMNLDKQGGNDYAMKTYSMQQHLDQVKVFPVSNQRNQSHFSSIAQNVVSSMSSQQPIGGVSVISHVSGHPTPSSIVGTTELKNGSVSSASRPAQLTIFYAGSVCVYDDVSPEKAQAIMLLAGHGSPPTHNKPAPAPAAAHPAAAPALAAAPPAPVVQLQSAIVRPSSSDGYIRNKSHTSPLISALSTPISLASTTTNDIAITVKPIGALTSTTSQTEQPKSVTSVGHNSSKTMIPSGAVPQARKASLARFLEKRKERVMTSSPYSVSSKSPDYSATISDSISLSMNSFSSSSHHLALKTGLR